MDDPDLVEPTRHGSYGTGGGIYGGFGDGRGLGHGPGKPGLPRHWEVMFSKGTTLDAYARQLDFFGIELGVLMPDNKIVYALILPSPSPTPARSAIPRHEREALLPHLAQRRDAAGRSRVARAGGSRFRGPADPEVPSPRNRGAVGRAGTELPRNGSEEDRQDPFRRSGRWETGSSSTCWSRLSEEIAGRSTPAGINHDFHRTISRPLGREGAFVAAGGRQPPPANRRGRKADLRRVVGQTLDQTRAPHVAQAKRLLASDEERRRPAKPAAAKPQAASRQPPAAQTTAARQSAPSRNRRRGTRLCAARGRTGRAPREAEAEGPKNRSPNRRPPSRKQPPSRNGAARAGRDRLPVRQRNAGAAAPTAPPRRLDLMSEAALTRRRGRQSAGRRRPPEAVVAVARLFARKPKVRIEAEEEKWGSSLMLVGGGSLLLVMILGVVLVWAIIRGDADKTFQLANDDYRAGSYAQAINKYNDFLEKFPKDAHASLARVKIGLAELREATQTAQLAGGAQGGQRGAEANRRGDGLQGSPRRVGRDVAARSPRGWPPRPGKKTDPALVAQAHAAVDLAENPRYVPKTLRQESKLKDVNDSLALTGREIARGNELDKTIAAHARGGEEVEDAGRLRGVQRPAAPIPRPGRQRPAQTGADGGFPGAAGAGESGFREVEAGRCKATTTPPRCGASRWPSPT